MEQGYTDITLIDCNRMNSEEGKSHNYSQPAQFTNKVGTGIKLNIGDKISVHSGFISDRGAGGETLEFEGKSTNESYSLEQTIRSKHQLYWGVNKYNGRSMEAFNPFGDLPPYNASCIQYKNTATTYAVKDTEAHMNISYYKTSNGEGYFQLPRRYDKFTPEDSAGGYAGHRGFSYDPASQPDNLANTARWYEWLAGVGDTPYPDCYRFGMTIPLFVGQDNLYAGANKRYFAAREQPSMRCKSDTYFYNKWENTPDALQNDGHSSKNTLHVDNCFMYGASGADPEENPDKSDYGSFLGYKYRNNNSRYTLYTKEVVYVGATNVGGDNVLPDVSKLGVNDDPDQTYGGDAVVNNTASRKDFTLITGDQQFHRDPALSDYVRYKETKTLSLPNGNQAPANVSDNLTNQLNSNVGKVTQEVVRVGGSADVSIPEEISSTKETETFKSFQCANSVTFQRSNYRAYSGMKGHLPNAATEIAGTTKAQATQVVDYLSSYATIGVKRPELWDAGRDVVKNCYSRKIGVGTDTAGGFLDTGKYAWMDVIYPKFIEGIPYSDKKTAIVKTTIEWTTDSLPFMLKWFQTQGQYPELFDGITDTNIGDSTSDTKYVNIGHNSSNTRFLHTNSANYGWGDGAFSGIYPGGANMINGQHLGGDNYYYQSLDESNGLHSTPCSQQSRPLFVWYDESRKDELNGGETDDELYGGFFIKYRHSDGKDYFAFSTKYIGGLSKYLWTNLDDENGSGDAYPITEPTPTDELHADRSLGYDPHFSAYGTDCICLYAGYLNADGMEAISGDYEPANFADLTGRASSQAFPIFQNIKERYVGANNPQISFDDKASRFNFQSLHTPENTGNAVNAGIDEEIPVIGVEAGNQVYKINKRLLGREFCPDLQRYVGFFKYQTNRAAWENSKRETSPSSGVYVYDVAKAYAQLYLMNANMSEWTIFDADCGIFIEDFGVSQNGWDASLWGILGFTWEQFNTNSDIVDRQFRGNDTITTENGSAYTTYANVEAADVSKWRVNLFGATLYGNQKPVPLASEEVQSGSIMLPAITNIQVSSQINADRLPRKMINSYYLVKSNIIGDSNYQGGEDGGQVLPIVYVVNKENGFGDFYFQGASQMEFTNTKARTMTEITTSIHNPDMSLANLSNHSAIVYKITKQIPAEMEVAQQILKSLKLAPDGSKPIKKNVWDGINE
jgi:hypothetical protein